LADVEKDTTTMSQQIIEFPVTGEGGVGKGLGTSTGPLNFILIRGGRDFVTCEDLVRAADEKHWRSTVNMLKFLAFYFAALVAAFALGGLALHPEWIPEVVKRLTR
jgi:hypothetical protein